MPDDTDDKLTDPAQVVASEPRSAVEAASNPAHGGGTPAFTEVEVPGQGIARMAMNPVTQNMNGLANSPPKADAPRTIVSGVDRIFGAIDGFSPLADDFAEFVATLSGDEKAVKDEVERITDSTVAHVHSAAEAVEEMFARMADLVKRAKAAHG